MKEVVKIAGGMLAEAYEEKRRYTKKRASIW